MRLETLLRGIKNCDKFVGHEDLWVKIPNSVGAL